MSAGVRKPPVAPKPKILQPQRPTPPPIAPKPDVVLSYRSPAAAKKAKPAVAPKPCLPKTTGIPAPEPKPLALKSTSQTWSHEKTGILENMGRLNSKNERGMELSRLDLDYIIPTCTCIQESCLQCNHVENSKTAEMAMDRGGKCPNEWQSSRTEESAVQVSPIPRPQSHLDKDKTENCKNHLVNARFLEQKLKDVWVQSVSTNMVCQKLQEKTQEQPVNNMVILDENLNCTDNANRSGGKCTLPERSHSDDTNGNIVPFSLFQEESKGPLENLSNAVGMGEEPRWSNVNTTVPSAPKKPLPVPMPRKLKRSLLVRQNGVELIASEEKEVGEKLQGEMNNSLVVMEGLCHSPETFVQTQSVSNLDSSDEYSIPPDDTAEKSSQHGFPPYETSHSLSDQMVGFSLIKNRREVEKFRCSISEEEEKKEEDEDEKEYGDFARYPMTRSLPKQLKLNCNLPLTVATRVTSVEESPKVVPKKPQRNSLPGSALLKTGQSEEELDRRDSGGGRESWGREDYSRKENGEAMREVSAPPAAKSPWRLRQAFVPFFKKQTSESSSHGNTQSKWAGCSLGKPRAKSFTSVELDRNDGQKRSSFRRFLELNVSVKLLSRLLAKRGQSLDCTTVAQEPSSAQEKIKEDRKATQKWQGRVSNSQCETPSNQPASGSESPCSPADWERSLDGGESLLGGESTVEYENVPLYAEIPEYMNLPFLGASGALTHQPDRHLGWWNSSSLEEGDGMENTYENQELHRPHDTSSLEEDAGLDGQPVPGEKFGSSSAEEDDVRPGRGEPEFRQSKAKTKVVHIAMEIMSSEKVFVDVLKLLHIDFRDAVAKATRQTGKPVIEERALNQILYYLPQLYELNRDLLKELEERVALWNKHQRLADIFVKMGPYLKMYSTYIREFDRNVALLDEQCRKNPGFAAVVREFELSPRSANLALKHYLLKPVQRIPQYQLLLTDYLKNLPEDSSDYKDTQAALGVVKEVASHANGIMKQGDNFQKLMRVQYSLNGQHEVVQPGRVFLKEGVLKKLSRKVMQPRMFFLFNDILLYTTPVQSAQYKLNGILPLAGMKVSKPSQEAYQNELNIESVERSFILSASSAAERDEWLEAISKAIDDYTRKKITFFSSKSQEEADVVAVDDRASLGSKAPIWIPDLRATMCMICTCEFTLTWRRHHCRACGKVICQACSSHKQYLEYLKYQPARVCDHCFLQLQKGDRSVCTSQSPSGRLSSVLNSIPARKQKKIPATLKEVSANTENSSMSGYLQRSKGNKKQWKRLWFVIKNKVLYTYAASEDVAALESQPLLGFYLREERSGSAPKLQFKLYHKNTLFYIFKADDLQTAQKWKDVFQEAMIL